MLARWRPCWCSVVLIGLLAAAPKAGAATILLDDGLVHEITDATHALDRLNVRDGPGGPRDFTTLNVRPGGEIHTTGSGRGVDLRESSRFQMTGGEIWGGSLGGAAMFMNGAALAHMSGGLIQGINLGSRAIEVQGGQFTITGGSIRGSGSQNRGLETRGVTAFARVLGGTITGFVEIEAREGSRMEIVGTTFSRPFGPITDNGGVLTGTLADGTSFVWDYGRTSDSTLILINAATITECNDGLDNDGDGLFDFPADPDCETEDAISESPVCDDGVDNDGDGFCDTAGAICTDGSSPGDPGCASPSWPFEDPQCDDQVDNDGDGFCDTAGAICTDGSTPGDANCGDFAFLRESPICSDGVDNDGDGFIDMDDPQCDSPTDQSETCGLGFELVLLLPLIFWARARLRRSRQARV